MICKIGSVALSAIEVESVQRVITPNWGEYKPLASNPHYHNTQGYKEKMTISGKFISDATSRITALDALARSKARTRITLATGESMACIVESVQTDRQKHLDGSGAVFKDYTITLIQVGGGSGGGLSLLMMIIGGLLALL